MRLPPPLIAAAGSLAVALGLAAIPLIVAGPTAAQAQDTPTQSVIMDEWSINPRQIVIKANQNVRFSLTNAGTTNTHEIMIAGQGIELHSPTLAQGETLSWDVMLTTPGTYEVWCPRGSGSHKDRGMVGTLRVVAADEDAVVEVPIQTGEYFVSPVAVTAIAGQTTRFRLQAVGRFDHAVQITGQGMDAMSPNVHPGDPVSWDIVFDTPGTYEIWCPYTAGGSHKDLGMVGTIEVLRGGGGM